MAKRRKLKSTEHTRMLLADTLRALEQKSSLDSPETAKLVIYGSKVLGELVRGVQMEERLARLEQTLHAEHDSGGRNGQDPDFQLGEATVIIPIPRDQV